MTEKVRRLEELVETQQQIINTLQTKSLQLNIVETTPSTISTIPSEGSISEFSKQQEKLDSLIKSLARLRYE